MESMDDFDQYCSWSKKPNEFMRHYQARALGSYEILDATDDIDNDEYEINDYGYNDNSYEDAYNNDTTMYRIRSFKRTHKGLINQGDRVKACSLLTLNLPTRSKSFTKGEKPFNLLYVDKQYLSSPEEQISINITPPNDKEDFLSNEKLNCKRTFEIFVMGKSSVGKTSLCDQFLTSDSCELNTNIESFGQNIQQVTVDLDGIEWTLIFHDYENPKRLDKTEKYPDAYMMVYSIDDKDTFDYLSQLLESISSSAIFIVGNKSDLERLRQVSTEKGKRMADIYDGEFFEVSTILNHMVDNLLVQIIMKIRRHIKKTQKEKISSSKYSLKNKKFSAGDVLLNFFRRLSKVF